jgi:hypothetical protein
MRLPSIIRRPWLIRHALRHPRIFLLGFREGSGDAGMTYDDDPWSPRSMAYDCGRDLRRWGG